MELRSYLFIFFLALQTISWSQVISSKEAMNKILAIENDSKKATDVKINQLLALEKEYSAKGSYQDSVDARLFHRLGAYYYAINNEVLNEKTLHYTTLAIRINKSGRTDAFPAFLTNSYYNLALCYKNFGQVSKAINYYDSVIQNEKKYHKYSDILLRACQDDAMILIKQGDFEKAIDICNTGILEFTGLNIEDCKHLLMIPMLEAMVRVKQYKNINTFFDTCITYLISNNSFSEAGDAIKEKAIYLAEINQYRTADSLFKKAITLHSKDKSSNPYEQIMNDYIDYAKFFFDKMQNPVGANAQYNQAYKYARLRKDKASLAKVLLSKAECYRLTGSLSTALQLNTQAFFIANNLNVDSSCPSMQQLYNIEDKETLVDLLSNRIKLLLDNEKNPTATYRLKTALQFAKVTDSVINTMRREQSGEESKLYWRKLSHEYYAHALETCYRLQDDAMGFSFMEKSRAVLLADRQKEAEAAYTYLPAAAQKQEEELQSDKRLQLTTLNATPLNSATYFVQYEKYIQAKTRMEHFIAELETKYPAYYQFKYADDVPKLTTVKNYLQHNKAAMLEYFFDDTVTYVMAINEAGVKMERLKSAAFNSNNLADFLQFSASKEKQNSRHLDYTAAAYLLYQFLWKPVDMKESRIIVSLDGVTIPFETLSADASGKDLLLYRHSFSYAYSARSLIRSFVPYPAKGNFIGIAPVQYNRQLGVNALLPAADALQKVSKEYTSTSLLLHENANRSNFLEQAGHYNVVNIFSHASANNDDEEPLLYMQDSVIHLSELQHFYQPATQLVVLSACQTNAGKNATGEGVYSLARGFSAAGIPSVAATLWAADEQSVYDISFLFHQNLAKGLPKDVALQQAKITYLQTIALEDNEKQLPYYWANMLLMGDSAPLRLTAPSNYIVKETGMIAGAVILSGLVVLYIQRRKKVKTKAAIKSLAE